jgi:hypothetical protein
MMAAMQLSHAAVYDVPLAQEGREAETQAGRAWLGGERA